MKKIKVGIVGCGTIGSALALILRRKFKSRAELSYLCEHHEEKAHLLMKKLGKKIPLVPAARLIQKSDLIIEAASAAISENIASLALRRNKEVLVLSVGGLLMNQSWVRAARKTRGHLWIPSGAVAGIDGLLAGKQAKLRQVQIKTQKPPEGLAEAPYFRMRKFPPLKGSEQVCVFMGNALQAIRAFPQNINVAALLSLAGLGPRKTKVEIWTSRAFKRNQHEITVEGDFGKITTRAENVPSPGNPKTSYLAILSATALLEKIFSRVRIGT
ncbi:MAG: DUF108 domain-containing protein [Candidatus Omnitrophica bacterium]|nr:DUF108 domain-containing protein [Candidatus Omnitrophota bacterium]